MTESSDHEAYLALVDRYSAVDYSNQQFVYSAPQVTLGVADEVVRCRGI
ncbi:MAG: hypothetical protein ABI045_05750 [Flavobacteriales bacterium]